jgi:hypothetical protein
MKLRLYARASLSVVFLGFSLFGWQQAAAQTALSGNEVAIPDKTRILAELKDDLDPAKAKVGDSVKLEAPQDVRSELNNSVLIPKKAKLFGQVSSVEPYVKEKGYAKVSIVLTKAEWKGGAAKLNAFVVGASAPVVVGTRGDSSRGLADLTPGPGLTGRRDEYERPRGVEPTDVHSVPSTGPKRFGSTSPFTQVDHGDVLLYSGDSSHPFLPSGTRFYFLEGDVQAQFQEYAEAQYLLGLRYHRGEGVSQSYAVAAAHYREAAEQGLAKAQNNLAVLYAEGQGVPQDYVTSYMWFSLAAPAMLEKNAANLRLLEGRMTPEQIAEGKSRAEEWLRQHPASH